MRVVKRDEKAPPPTLAQPIMQQTKQGTSGAPKARNGARRMSIEEEMYGAFENLIVDAHGARELRKRADFDNAMRQKQIKVCSLMC